MSTEHAEKLNQIKQLIESCMASEIDNDNEVDKAVIDSMACFYQSMTRNLPIKGIACKDVLQLKNENAELKKKVEDWLSLFLIVQMQDIEYTPELLAAMDKVTGLKRPSKEKQP